MTAVLGLDVSSRSTGVASVDGTCSTIAPRATAGWRRMDALQRAVVAQLRSGRPDLAAVEGYSMGGLRGLASISLAEAGGIVRWQLGRHGVPVVEIPPATLKVFAVGSGGKLATKEAMVAAARSAGAVVANDDEADAALLRLMALAALGEPVWSGSERADEALVRLRAHPTIKALSGQEARTG